MSTIYDVASLAGVSPATVSRVLNGTPVSPEKARLVREAAETLSFTPNRTARSLRKQHSEVIALVIPDIENPFFTSVARGVEDVAQAAGFSVVLCNTDDDPDKEARYLRIAVSENMAGVILATAGGQASLAPLMDRDRPIVAVDRRADGYDIDSVLLDSAAGGRDATRALFAQGFRRVACITGPSAVETAERRAQGWREVVRENGAETDAYLRYADFRISGGRAAMAELLALETPPDAVFVANNLMSVGALQILAERGLTPPHVGMAVFGDLPFLLELPAGVTVIPLPARQLGARAASLLLERLRGDKQPARTVVLSNNPSSQDAQSA
jgi:LacI family transcriptional regulator